ncbi:proteasome subunit beta type-6-like [Carex rostrata]
MDLDLSAPHSMGTTIIGVTYNGGVILGADSRTSTGMYVANRASDKITQLTDNVYVCRSGSAADTQVISDYVRYFLHQHTSSWATGNGESSSQPLYASNHPFVRKKKLLIEICLTCQNMLKAGVIVGGWDKYGGGPIYSVPLGGTILRQPFSIGGSGSSYLYGFFDQAWKERMTREEAEHLVIKAASLAMACDGANGGVARTVTINAEGVTRKFYGGDTLPLWHNELLPTNSLLDILSSSVPEPMST